MKESNLNTVINNGFKQLGFSHKVSDGVGGISVQNPFDGFSVNNYGFWYWESKLIKPLKSFNFSLLEDHQIYNMNLIRKEQPIAKTIYPIGFFEPRKYFYLMFFDSELVRYLKENDKNSIIKKELQVLLDLEKYYIIKRNKELKKYEVILDNPVDKIITLDFWKEHEDEICKKSKKKEIK